MRFGFELRQGLFCREEKRLKKVEEWGVERMRNGEAPRFCFFFFFWNDGDEEGCLDGVIGG